MIPIFNDNLWYSRSFNFSKIWLFDLRFYFIKNLFILSTFIFSFLSFLYIIYLNFLINCFFPKLLRYSQQNILLLLTDNFRSLNGLILFFLYYFLSNFRFYYFSYWHLYFFIQRPEIYWKNFLFRVGNLNFGSFHLFTQLI